jgi:hypothetical protein
MMRFAIFVVLVVLSGCDDMDGSRRAQAIADKAWEGPCADTSWLLATTAGSPDRATCPNKAHRMRVQVATTPSHEEIGALVFCECQRPGEDERKDDGGR